MYNVRVEDLIDVKENKSPFALNDLIHICKRKNNSKRDYLFVDRFQGKHIPESPTKILTLFDSFYSEIESKLNKDDKVIVVGFAETATGLAEYVSNRMVKSAKLSKSFVYHLQTTREEYVDSKKLFTFDEEHSHAVSQFLYCDDKLPEFNRVLFIEDEITTGKTILNFIDKFREINSDCKYSVASILNWQNEESIEKYNTESIDRIYLVSGGIKENIESLVIDENEVFEYFGSDLKHSYQDDTCISDIKYKNSRLGISAKDVKKSYDRIVKDMLYEIDTFIEEDDNVMFIGTEEYMYIPLMIAYHYEKNNKCESATYRATTRSPITPSVEDGYIIKDGMSISSAYGDRKTFLYNLNGDYNKIVMISDTYINEDLKQQMCDFAGKNNKKILFVEV